jgi:PIN domain nuclease of toxin-antitoxin system
MQYLLDTHTLLWLVATPSMLSSRVTELLADATNTVFVSTASIWEVAIKTNIGKLRLNYSLPYLVETLLPASSIELLAISPKHLYHYSMLPLHHRDPFDRLLAAQALSEQLTLISLDTAFDPYFSSLPQQRLW